MELQQNIVSGIQIEKEFLMIKLRQLISEKDGKEDTKKKAAPKAEEKKDQKPAEKNEAAPKAEEKKDQK